MLNLSYDRNKKTNVNKSKKEIPTDADLLYMGICTAD